MGVETLQTGVFGGIFIGAVAAIMYNRFYNIKLPNLGFFAGKRFVPIVTGLSAIVVGAILAFAWPPVGQLLDAFSHWAAYQNPVLAWAVCGAGERSLLPVGLHHIWNAPFFFEVGSYIDQKPAKSLPVSSLASSRAIKPQVICLVALCTPCGRYQQRHWRFTTARLLSVRKSSAV